MKLNYKWIFTLLLAFFLQFSFAQERTITGKVSDLSGPLPGVNVSVKGSPKGIQTDFDGKYSINAKTGDVIVFSFVGMKEKQVTVGSSTKINVVLESEASALEEVVIVAYGQQKTKSIVGSVATVGKDVLEKQVATSVLTSLQGSVAGVNVISSGGQPGDNPTIRIRGTSSLSASSDPLIILDGAPYVGNYNSISADQIESMTVLKDASSTALYGSRGSNGVILINTKRGKMNTPTSVNFSTMLGVASNAVDLHQMVSTDRFMELSWEARRNVNQYGSGQTAAVAGVNASNSLVSALGYNPYQATVPVDPTGKLVTTNKYWTNDWEEEIINDSAIRRESTVSVNGGGESTAYSFSINNLTQEGVVKESNFDRTTARLNVDTKINKTFSLGANMGYSTSSQNYPVQSGTSFQSPIQWIYNISSVYPLHRYNASGALILDGNGNRIYDYGANPGSLNATRPVFQNENAVGALYNYVIENKRDDFTFNGYVGINIAKGLTFKSTFAYEKYLFDSYEYSSTLVGNAASVKGRITQNRDITTTYNLTNALNYKKDFGNHSIFADLIQEAYSYKIDRLYARGEGFLPGVEVLDGATKPVGVGGSISEERLASYLGRVGYNYAGKYFIEGSFRTDGSSKFDQEVRWGNFYSVGGAWSLKDESFLKDSNLISALKLKASYGELGNNRTDSFFPYQQLYNVGWSEAANIGVILGAPADKGLTWEKTASSNIGIEVGMFKNRLVFGADYYNKESIDQIYAVPVPGSTGNTTYLTNAASVSNYGWEFYLNSVNIQNKNFTWTTNLNFSFDENELTELADNQQFVINGTKRWEVGKSIYEFWIQEWAGVDPADGRGMWYRDGVDVNGNRNTTKTYSQATRNYTGKSSLPDVIGGLTNYFKYKGFDMNILFNFSYGSYVYDSSYASLMTGLRDPGRPGHVDLENRWQKAGDVTDVPLLYQGQQDFASQSTRFLFKNDYIRLKALNIGYNMPKDFVNKVGMNNFRVFLQGDNLWTYQSHEGIDPEQSLAGTTDSRSYNQRLVSLGLSLGF